MLAFASFPVSNLYISPDEGTEVVSQALYGWPLTLLKETGGFYKVQTLDYYEGWILKSHIHQKQSIHPHSQPFFVTIRSNAAHIYIEPDVTTRKPLLTLPFEVSLEVVQESEEENERWIQIKLIDGQTGWIQRGDVSFSSPIYSWQEMIQLSQQFLGLPYTWGGTSSFGYDCSGYIQMLYRQMGIFLPRDARDQIKYPAFHKVSENEQAAGDLVFFGHSEQKIIHVALLVDSHTLIHASTKPRPVLQLTEYNNVDLQQRYAYRSVHRFQKSS